MTACDVERGEVFALVIEREDTDADAARDAKQQGFGEWLTGVRGADAVMRQENAQSRRRRNVAGKMPARDRILILLLSLADDVAASNGVTLTGLLHAGADELFEMFLCGHC